jgi:hypothetical protein
VRYAYMMRRFARMMRDIESPEKNTSANSADPTSHEVDDG